VSDRIERLVQEVEALADPHARAKARELVQAVLELHARGLARALELAGDRRDALASDRAVSALLLLHGIHPEPLETRVARALDGVRPALHAHGGDVELLSVEGGLVRLRLEGSCHGCPSSQRTLREAIESAVLEAAPDALGLEVEGAVPEPAGLVPLTRRA